MQRQNNKKNSNVTIPTKYVKENFVVFLYLEEANTKDDFLYIFFHDDIKLWRTEAMNFKLIIPQYFYNREEFKERLLNREAITEIKNILLKQAVNKLIKTNTSIIIDGIFLEKAVKKTQSFYKKLYPEKIFLKPNIDFIVEQLLKYTYVERKNEVNCYLIYSSDFS